MVLRAGPVALVTRSAPPSTATPKPATLASRTRRRADRVRDFGAGALVVIRVYSIFLCGRHRRAPDCRATRWGALHYRALSGELNFGKSGSGLKTRANRTAYTPRPEIF